MADVDPDNFFLRHASLNGKIQHPRSKFYQRASETKD